MEIHTEKQKVTGTVYLVGAGPGDEGLLTVKGRKLLKEADVIIYDHLANPALLGYAKKECEKIYVGKENHRHTMPQKEINELLVEKARQFQKVVRLKGGDVYVFGRGGEEGIHLREQGIPFEVIPGVSSPIAGLAYAGIPVTHRGIARGFRIITAHSQGGQPADIDFDALARTKDTCVFLMGFSKLDELTQNMIQAGMPPFRPVAVISNATLPSQKTCVGTLETIARQVRESNLTSPALIVVGDVVNLRTSLSFFEEKPLFGKQFLVTKIGEESSYLANILREKGARVTEVQTGEIRMIPDGVKKEILSRAHWIVLTSRHGVDAFFASLKVQRIDIRILSYKKFAVIGIKTAKALERYGIYADFVPPVFDSESLRNALAKAIKPGETVAYGVPAGVEDKELMGLKGYATIEIMRLYENLECRISTAHTPGVWAQEGSPSTFPDYDGAFFTCASSVNRYLGSLGEEERTPFQTGRIEAISIGKNTTQALKEWGVLKIRQSLSSTYEGMIEAMSFI